MKDMILVIGREGCGYSSNAEKLVENISNKNVIYRSIKNDSAKKQEVKKVLNVDENTTFPMVFMFWKGKKEQKKYYHIGGFTEFNDVCNGHCEKKLYDKVQRKIFSKEK